MRKCCLHFESPCVYRQFCNTKIRICCPICALMFRIILHTECIRIALDCLNRQIWFLKLLCFGFVHLVVPACTDVSEGPSVPIFRQSWTVHVSAELTRLLLPRYSVYPQLIHPPWGWLQDVSPVRQKTWSSKGANFSPLKKEEKAIIEQHVPWKRDNSHVLYLHRTDRLVLVLWTRYVFCEVLTEFRMSFL